MNLLIRADANTRIGTGHAMRCLALAQAWQEAGGQATFVTGIQSPALERRLSSEGMEVVHLLARSGSTGDVEQTIDLALQRRTNWVVTDGYHFGADYQQRIKNAGLRLLFIDDYGHADHYSADLVLNQNINTSEALYPRRESYTQLLLGTRYALLRREFLSWKEWKREIPDAAYRVLVTLGGGDPENVTLKVVQAIQNMNNPDLEVRVVLGPSNPHITSLKDAILSAPCSMRILENVSNMPELMAWADLAISGGGSTCWELAFIGLPALLLILAENQRNVVTELNDIGNGQSLGWHDSLSPLDIVEALTQLIISQKTREEMAQRGQQLIDGNGCKRVVQRMMNYTISLRPLQVDDCRLIWEWANDPVIRAASFSTEPISWEEHVTWFQNKLSDHQCFFYLALNDARVPVGQVRYQISGPEAEVSVNVAPNLRGIGYGSQIIHLAMRRLCKDISLREVHAYVKPDNIASVHAFSRAGFVCHGLANVKGSKALHFSFKCQEPSSWADT